MEEHHRRHIGGLPGKRLLRLRIHLLCEGHRRIVQGNFLELIVHHIGDGVLDAETRQQQRRAAADAQHHHEEPLLVPQHVPQGYLGQKAQPLPQEGDALQQHPLALLGGLGPDQFRRHLPQEATAHQIGGPQSAQQIGGYGDGRQLPIQHKFNGDPEAVHDVIGVPEDLGKDVGASHKADGAPQQRSAAGVKEVLEQDGPPAIAHGHQYAQLGALFLHHAGHGGDAHQRRQQEEEQREHTGNSRHNVGVALEAYIAHVGVPAQHIGVRLFQILQLLPGIVQFPLMVGQFPFAVLQLLPGALQLGTCLLQLGLGCRQLPGRLLQLLLRLCQLPLRGIQRRTRRIQLGLALGQLRRRCLQLRLILRKLRRCGVQLLLHGRQLGLQDRQLRAILRQGRRLLLQQLILRQRLLILLLCRLILPLALLIGGLPLIILAHAVFIVLPGRLIGRPATVIFFQPIPVLAGALYIGCMSVLVLGKAVVVFRPARFQLLPGIVQLLLGIRQLFLRLTAERVVPQLRPLGCQLLQGLLHGLHGIVIGRRIDAAIGPGEGHVDLRVVVHRKALRQ